jgi:tetratricopeptide (TPR) repeat protein
MARMSHHEDSVVAAQEAFGDLKALERQLGFYIQGAQYKQFVQSSAVAAIDPASYKVRVLTQAEFDARRADLMAYIGRTDDARALLKSVLASNPNLPEPHETMGYLNLQSGDRDGARNAYLEAIHLNSQDFLAYYQFANISMTGSYKQDDPQIESSLQTSIKLNPQFAFAYDDLSSIYARSRDRLEDAQGLNNQAVQLDRTNFYFRINAANLFMMRDKPDQAERCCSLPERWPIRPNKARWLRSG